MQPYAFRFILPAFMILLITMLACNLTGGATQVSPSSQEPVLLIPIAGQLSTPTAVPSSIPATAAVVLTHSLTPAAPQGGKTVYDVESSGTAPERRAPYGDSYDLNRLERPFSQDMTYIPDLDIVKFTVAKDNDWWYVSMDLIGMDPNNAQGIHYGAELDLDRDGFGDFLLWAHPPYTNQWDTLPVRIYQDHNHNTGGLSGARSDAPFNADGYETLIFDGSAGGADPDIAWVRIGAGADAIVQFAFKRSWSGDVFMLGVLADAGLKDPGKLDYVDRSAIAEAGSPVKDNRYYPLKALFSVDNTCRGAIGFEPTHYEPQGCPVEPTPTPKPRQRPQEGPTEVPPPQGCQPDPTCPFGWDAINCMCAVG